MPKRKIHNLSESPELINFRSNLKGYEKELGFIAGLNSDEGVYNTRGCQVTADLVLAKTDYPGQLYLAMRLGDSWVRLTGVPDHNKVLEEIKSHDSFVERGPSPEQIARKEKFAKDKADREAQALAHREERSRIARERLQGRRTA